MIQDEIYHYGVKGMKWGQRRAITKLQKYRSRERQASSDYTKVLLDSGIDSRKAKKARRKLENARYRGNQAASKFLKKYGAEALDSSHTGYFSARGAERLMKIM